MKKGFFYPVMAVITALSIIAGIFFSVRILDRDKEKDTETMCSVLSSGLYTVVDSAISEPINISLTMANDSFLINALREEDKQSEAEMADIMKRYLSSLKEGVSADTAFIISEKSRRYYSYQGLNKVLDTVNDEHDIWYSIFVNGKKAYDLDVDADQVNSDRWTVFVNARIEDENGELLGVCGVGINMTEMQNTLKDYEENYGVKVDLVNSDGIVQVDTDAVNIETSYLYDVQYGKERDGYGYRSDGNYVIMRYVENLNWYLVVRYPYIPVSKDGVSMIIAGSCVLAVNLAVFAVCFFRKNKKEKTQ